MSASGEALYAVFRYVRPLHIASARAVARSLANEPISLPMRAVIERLHDDGPQTVPQLARSLWLPRQVIQRLADDIAALGLLEWRPNPAHKRSRLARLTETGTALFERLHSAELALLEHLAGDLSADDVATTVRVMARLTSAVRAVSPADGSPTPATVADEEKEF
jgi:DNA-binding MarR family transcriptional regulator